MQSLGVLAVVALVAFGLGSEAADAGPPPLLLSIKKTPNGEYSDVADVNLGPGKTKEFKLRADNNNNAVDNDVFLESEPDSDGYKTKYFRKQHNVSPQVKGAGYDFRLNQGSSKTFKLTVKAPESPGALCRIIYLRQQGGGVDYGNAFLTVNAPVC
ncbi:MAG: hypothetical protein ACRDWD_02090 [Acidimicrobiia bacterium]